MTFQIDDLRLSLTRQEREHAHREEMLKQEISDLQQVDIFTGGGGGHGSLLVEGTLFKIHSKISYLTPVG